MPAKTAITMDDIARLANVSKPTVSRALSNSPLVNPETKRRVLEVAKSHGYAVNRNAQNLRHKRTNTIGVSLDFLSHKKNHISDPFIFDLLAGVSEALGEANQDLLLCAPVHNDTDALQQILSSRVADGFIILGQGHRELMLGELARDGAPIVVWGAGNKRTPYCVIGSDNFAGGQLAGEHFLKQNRGRFLFAGDTTFREIKLRRAGLEDIANRSGTTVSISDIALSHFSFEAAFDAANNYLQTVSEPADAVFAYNDTAAMAFVRAFLDAGLSVPGDVSVVGYNDIPSAAYFNPSITTIRQDPYQAGELLVSNLMNMLDGISPLSATIKTELIVRDT